MTNRELKVKQVQELRRSSASARHDTRPKRQRTRAAAKQHAMREQA